MTGALVLRSVPITSILSMSFLYNDPTSFFIFSAVGMPIKTPPLFFFERAIVFEISRSIALPPMPSVTPCIRELRLIAATSVTDPPILTTMLAFDEEIFFPAP